MVLLADFYGMYDRVAKQPASEPLLVLNHGSLYESYLCMLYSVCELLANSPSFSWRLWGPLARDRNRDVSAAFQ